MTEEQHYTVSSGNVFADLGIAEPETALAKAALAHRIATIIARRGWTQAQAAAALGLDQPKVSALTRGRLAGFSLERLIRLLVALGEDVTIVVSPKPPTHPHAHLSVTAEPASVS